MLFYLKSRKIGNGLNFVHFTRIKIIILSISLLLGIVLECLTIGIIEKTVLFMQLKVYFR